MRISIALATYNGAKYLPEQLESFINQTRQPDELIVSDDGSTDNTREILQRFAETAPFEVHLCVNGGSGGYASNFNSSIMQTTGDLVFLSDQDDLWFPQKLEFIEKLAQENTDYLLFMNDAALTDADLNDTGLTKLGQFRSLGIPERQFVMGCCCAAKRDLLDLCLPIPDGFKAHDDWIVSFAAGLGAKMICRQVLQYYRRHNNNESQLMVNRTTKVKKWYRYKEFASRVRSPVPEDLAQSEVLQQQLILSGIQRAQKRTTGRFTHQLKTMESQSRAILSMLETRMDIRRKCLPARFVASLSNWLRGGYRLASGFKSLVRDLRG
jgi:glycosyltransferase involved in cell wall biosynthesis